VSVTQLLTNCSDFRKFCVTVRPNLVQRRWMLHQTLCWDHKHVEFYIHAILFISLRFTAVSPCLWLDLWPDTLSTGHLSATQYIWPINSVRCFMWLNFVLLCFRVRKFWAVLPGSSLRPHLNGSLYAHVVAPLNTASMSLMSLLYCK